MEQPELPFRDEDDDRDAAAFERFHAANPHVYGLFKRFAAELLAAGRERYSARTIVERIRWHVATGTKTDDGFKISDHFSAFYARLWLAEHPEREGFFVLRGKRGKVTT